MSTRSLTEIFVLMRNNASQTRNIFSDQGSSDRVALVSNMDDVELGVIPPSWSSIVEDCQFAIVRLKIKLNSLNELHVKAISRPTFDDSSQDEAQIQQLSDEISRMYNTLYKNVGHIYNEASSTDSPLEQKLVKSVSSALVAELQELFTWFRSMESNYKNKLRGREERSRQYFDEDVFADTREDDSMLTTASAIDTTPLFQHQAQQQTQKQTFFNSGDLEWRIQEAAENEREVDALLSSVIELRDIQRELAALVLHEGTVLDRIDYNIETTQCQVKQATVQLERAARYQRGSKKMICIIILASVTTFMTVLLIITKL